MGPGADLRHGAVIVFEGVRGGLFDDEDVDRRALDIAQEKDG